MVKSESQALCLENIEGNQHMWVQRTTPDLHLPQSHPFNTSFYLWGNWSLRRGWLSQHCPGKPALLLSGFLCLPCPVPHVPRPAVRRFWAEAAGFQQGLVAP